MRSLKEILIIIFTILVFCGCQNKNERKIIKVKDIEFNIGFEADRIGNYFDENTKTELLYFHDYHCRKKILFFDLNGNFIDSVPLIEARNYLKDINNLDIISMDTIVVNSKHLNKNKIVVIDRKGKIWKTIDIDSIADKYNGRKYRMHTSFYKNYINNKKDIFLTPTYYPEDDIGIIKSNEKFKKGAFQYYKDCYEISYESPYFLKISNFLSPKPKCEYGLKDFYKNLSNKPINLNELSKFLFINNKLLVCSQFSDTIYNIDIDKMIINNKYPINSKYSKLFRKPLPMTEESYKNIWEKSLLESQLSGSISNLLFNNKTNKYNVIVYHEINQQALDTLEFTERPFSILVYDTLFNKKEEFAFTDGLYWGGISIMTSEGLMIKKNNKHEKNYKKSVFTLFKFE